MSLERKHALTNELNLARACKMKNDFKGEFSHLERAHVLSQPHALLHVKVHFFMLGSGLRRWDIREIIGQVFRLLAAAPVTFAKQYPRGNTGGSNVSAFKQMPLPEDLQKYFGS